MVCLINFVIILNILKVKKLVLQMAFHSVIILIKSVVNKNKNKCYFNMFLEKGFYKDKLMSVHFKCYIMIELTFLKEWILI